MRLVGAPGRDVDFPSYIHILLYSQFALEDEPMVEHLRKADFIDKVFDFEKNDQWKFAGDLPAIIDFWAEWCPPCRMISPLLEEISTKYEGKLHVYKVNTDEETDIAAAFRVLSIPTLLFIPMREQPHLSVGALPKAGIERLVTEVLEVE
jgi:thioredoxin 1